MKYSQLIILSLMVLISVSCGKKEDDDDTVADNSNTCQFDLLTQYDLDSDVPTADFDRVDGSITVVKKIISQSTCEDYPNGSLDNVNFTSRISRSNPGDGVVLVFYDAEGYPDQSMTLLNSDEADTHYFSNLDDITLTSNGKTLLYETKSVYVWGNYADPLYDNSIYFFQTVTVSDE
jgi:hypothetical protein